MSTTESREQEKRKKSRRKFIVIHNEKNIDAEKVLQQIVFFSDVSKYE